MREIKFRCWNKAWGRFKDGCNVIADDGTIGHDISTGILWQNAEQRDNYVIQQSTGLKDCKGKDIFEGDLLISDIVHINNESDIEKEPCIVVWIDKRAGFFLKKGDSIYSLSEMMYGWSPEVFEVIGNIFEMPELLSK